MLVLPNVTMEPSNVRKNKGITECDKSIVTCNVVTAQCKDETIKYKKTNKKTIKCNKSIVKCDVGTAQCEDETVKCEKKNKRTTKC